MRRGLADEEFRGRRDQPRIGGLVGIVCRPVESARQAERQRRRALDLQREIGEHGAHQRLVDQPPLEDPALARMMGGLRQGEAHQPRRGDDAIEPRHLHHFDDRAHALPFRPRPARRRPIGTRLPRRRWSDCRACP